MAPGVPNRGLLRHAESACHVDCLDRGLLHGAQRDGVLACAGTGADVALAFNRAAPRTRDGVSHPNSAGRNSAVPSR